MYYNKFIYILIYKIIIRLFMSDVFDLLTEYLQDFLTGPSSY